MEKEEFRKIVEKLILPLFTGSYISGEETSSSRDSEVAFGEKNSVLLKPNKGAEYRLVLNRSQPFKSIELNLLKSIISELALISLIASTDENYLEILQSHAIEKAICSTLAEDPDTTTTLLGLVGEIGKWASRTYEGKKVALGIIINQNLDSSSDANKIHFSEIISEDFFALLSDGKHSYVEFGKYGNLLGYVQLSKIRMAPTIAPHDFELIARYCNERRIGIILTNTGDLLMFKNRQLLYAKRRGMWQVYSHEEVIQLLSGRKENYTLKEIRRSIYLTALDSSFAYNGGCLVYLDKGMVEQALMHINEHDILNEKYYEMKKAMEIEHAGKLYNLQTLSTVEALYSQPYEKFLVEQKCHKAIALRKIIAGRPFQDLNRRLRQEIVSMDGATIVDSDGTIIATGAILKIEAGSEGGGRLAAAMTLAKYGISIKISQDGTMQGFYNDRKTGRLKSLFNVG